MREQHTPFAAFPSVPEHLSGPAPRQAPNVALISPFDEDHASLTRILSGSGCRLCTSRSGREGLACLSRVTAPVVICEQRLPDGDWAAVLAQLDRVPYRPLLIVASSLADERLWGEVLNVGGYDLLWKPFDKNEVRWVVGLALQHWSRLQLPAGRVNGKAAAHH